MYILRCSDDSYYVGSTWDLERRLIQHNSGFAAKYTSNRLPVTLEFYEEYDRIEDAFRREKQVQNWGRAKREALMRGEFEALRALSRSRRARPPE
jgi:putative endonuclease